MRRTLERGFMLLLWSLALGGFAVVLMLGYASFFRQSGFVSDTSFQRAQAFAMAEAGFEEAIHELNAGLSDRGFLGNALLSQFTAGIPAAQYVDSNQDGYIAYPDLLGQLRSWFSTNVGWSPCNGIANCFERSDSEFKAGDGSNETVGSYTVQVKNVGYTTMTDADGFYYKQVRGAPTREIVSTGTVGNRQTAIRAILERTKPDFRYAAFGKHYVHIQGKVVVDSYDSSIGPYDPNTPGSNADIGTNASDPVVGTDLLVSIIDGCGPPCQVHGKAYITPGTTQQIDAGDLTGGTADQMDQKLPPVVIPTSLSSLPITVSTSSGWSGFTNAGGGNWACAGTCTCSEAVHIKSLYDITGTVNIDTGCQLFIDRQNSMHSGILDTNGAGKLLKNGTDTTQIFIKDGLFNLEGGGATWSTAVPLADRKPEHFQLYHTGTGCEVGCGIAQRLYGETTKEGAFFGTVYVENGRLDLRQGIESGVNYNAEYFGAFAAGTGLTMIENNGGQVVINVRVHYDESLFGLPLDGTGRPPESYTGDPPTKFWRIKSWQVTEQ